VTIHDDSTMIVGSELENESTGCCHHMSILMYILPNSPLLPQWQF